MFLPPWRLLAGYIHTRSVGIVLYSSTGVQHDELVRNHEDGVLTTGIGRFCPLPTYIDRAKNAGVARTTIAGLSQRLQQQQHIRNGTACRHR